MNEFLIDNIAKQKGANLTEEDILLIIEYYHATSHRKLRFARSKARSHPTFGSVFRKMTDLDFHGYWSQVGAIRKSESPLTNQVALVETMMDFHNKYEESFRLAMQGYATDSGFVTPPNPQHAKNVADSHLNFLERIGLNTKLAVDESLQVKEEKNKGTGKVTVEGFTFEVVEKPKENDSES